MASITSNPLQEVGILQRVLSYVGPGHWFFLSTVSSLWRELYSRVADAKILMLYFPHILVEEDYFPPESRYGVYEDCRPQMTLYSTVFASPSRVRLAHSCGLDVSTASFEHAAGRHADVATLATAHELGMQYSEETMRGAAQCNMLPVIQYLHAQGCPWDSLVTYIAASNNDFQMLRWAHEHGCPVNNRYIMRAAASSGNIEIAAWLLQQQLGCCDDHAMDSAAEQGHTAMCAFVLENAERTPLAWSAFMCESAALHGHADTLRWLREHSCPWDAGYVCGEAAVGGSVDVMIYLQQQGMLASADRLTYMLDSAGAHNHLAAAQWLRQQGAEWPAQLKLWVPELLAWARAELHI
jgi:hypothetical protein